MRQHQRHDLHHLRPQAHERRAVSNLSLPRHRQRVQHNGDDGRMRAVMQVLRLYRLCLPRSATELLRLLQSEGRVASVTWKPYRCALLHCTRACYPAR